MQYIIDLREEDELKSKRLLSQNSLITIINIPTSIITKNIDYINNLSKKSKIYLACRRGIRSTKIKNDYFPNNSNITTIGPIENATKLFTNIVLIQEDNNEKYLFAGFGLLLGVTLSMFK